MATITNKERGPITLPTGHVIPASGVLSIDNATIRQPDNWPSLSGRALAGQISITFDPEPDSADPGATTTQTITPPAPNAVLELVEMTPTTKTAPKPAKG